MIFFDFPSDFWSKVGGYYYSSGGDWEGHWDRPENTFIDAALMSSLRVLCRPQDRIFQHQDWSGVNNVASVTSGEEEGDRSLEPVLLVAFLEQPTFPLSRELDLDARRGCSVLVMELPPNL